MTIKKNKSRRGYTDKFRLNDKKNKHRSSRKKVKMLLDYDNASVILENSPELDQMKAEVPNDD